MNPSMRPLLWGTLLIAAVAAASSRTPEQAAPTKIVHAPVKMAGGSALEALDLVGEARRLRVYTQLRGIDDPGDAKLLFPANVKSQLGLTDQQANLLFHTGIRQSNRFETFDDSDTKVRDGARQSYKGENMDIVIEGEFVSERQEIIDISPYKKVHTSMRLIATMRDVKTGRELFSGAVSTVGEWGAVQGEGVLIPPGGNASSPQVELSMGQ